MHNLSGNSLSVVVPLYNEAAGLEAFHASLINSLQKSIDETYEIIYCDDGSTDGTDKIIKQFHAQNPNIKLLKLSRNFGKENALTAGIAAASGKAILMLDGDGQHPVELIPEFLQAWQAGAKIVIGLRTNASGKGLIKGLGTRWFYSLFNKFTGTKLIPGSTDFRLIDADVQSVFLELKETDRITRGLLDWLGFNPVYISFTSKPRLSGRPTYSRRKLLALGMNSIVSLSPIPLYVFGYLGIFITISSFVLGTAIIIEQLLLNDPMHWRFTGTAMLSILLLFLIGLVLLSQGLLSLYISRIHNQTKHRPLFIIDYKGSAGVKQHS